MARKYLKYTDSDLEEAVKTSISIAQVLDKLSLVKAGGNYGNIKKKIFKLGLDTSHFKGQSWSNGEALKNFEDYRDNTRLKIALVRVRGHRCESCLNTEWLSEDITLELHHIDGSRSNNHESNLQLLCPNCHAVTDNWRGRNIKV